LVHFSAPATALPTSHHGTWSLSEHRPIQSKKNLIVYQKTTRKTGLSFDIQYYYIDYGTNGEVMSKLYTGKGDDGSTGVLGKERVRKSDLIMEVLGTLDELSASLGNAKSQTHEKPIYEALEQIQRDLYKIMSEVAAVSTKSLKLTPFPAEKVEALEKWIALWEQDIVLPDEFILPGETQLSAAFSICRTVARRAERRLVDFAGGKNQFNPEVLRYMNRLSSLFYVLEIRSSKKGSKQKLKFARI
jgi:cob(I)alamin adenosyltransferase